jgi:hypothetical protein
MTVFEDQDGGLNGLGLGDWIRSIVGLGRVGWSYILDWRHIGAFAGTTAVEHRGTSLMISFVISVGVIRRRAFRGAVDGVGNRDRVVERLIR